jgi:putative ABC transport system ATP-binding protein
VLREVSFSFHPGDRIVLFGPSGCGKTTLLHLLALLDRPTDGNLSFSGNDTAPWTEAECCRFRAESIGMVFQHFHILPYHSALHNVELATRYRKPVPHDLPAHTLLQRVGLEHRAGIPARLLSGGEKQRLCIARALQGNPKLLLADEPTGNLDLKNSENIRRLFNDLSQPDILTVVATHDPEWRSFATRILEFSAEGSLTEVAT